MQEKKGNQGTTWFLYFCSTTANLFLFSTGNILAWNSPVLPKLLSNDTEVNPFGEPITIFQESLIIGLVPFGTLIGAGIVGKIPDLIGRRKTLIYLATIQLSCFVVIGFATHVYVYISFIALMVMSNVAATIVVPIYTTEISEDHNRGKLGCIVSVAIASGQFYGYLVGPLTSIRIFAFLCVIPLVMFLLLCWFIPETPIYSVLKSDKSNALANLQRLRKSKKSIEIEEEYAKIEESIESKLNKESKVNFFDLFKSHAGKKAFLLALIVRVLQYSSGIYIITSFLGTFLDEAGGSISGHSLAVAVAAGKICASFVTVNVIERLGRRLLLLVGSGICGTSMFVLAVHFFLKSNDIPLPEYLRYMPVIAVIFFVTANIFGLNAVAFIVIAELLPSEFRAVGTSVVLMICAVINICITFAYSYVVEYLGMHYAMCTFGIIAFVGFSLVFKFLPETKGKSFSDIKKMLE